MEGRSAEAVTGSGRQPQAPDRSPGQLATAVEGAIGRAATLAASVAGTVGLLYVIGGAVLWLRFHEAGLPADRAVAVVPKADLLVLGLRVMVIPALLAGGATLLLLAWRGAGEGPDERRDRVPSEDPPPPAPGGELHAGLTAMRRGFRRHRLRSIGLAAAAVLVAVLVPFSIGSFAWPLAFAGLVGYWLRLKRMTPAGAQLPVLRLAVAAILAASLISVARQTDRPVDLVSVRAEIENPSPLLERELSEATVRGEGRRKVMEASGILVALTDEAVHIGDPRNRIIAAIPRESAVTLTVGPPLDQQAPPPSLLGRLIWKDAAWAITPLELWCHNVRYGWLNILDACREHPRLVIDSDLRIADGEVTGIELACPERVDFCRGFLILRSERAASNARATALPVRLRPVAFALTGGDEREITLDVDASELWEHFGRDRASSRKEQRIPVVVSASLEGLGKAVLDRQRATLVVPVPERSEDPEEAEPVPSSGDPPPPPDPGDGTPGGEGTGTGGAVGTPTPEPTPDPSPTPQQAQEYHGGGGLPPQHESLEVPP